MDLPPGVEELLIRFGEAVRLPAGVTGLYAGGSLATGDYRPAVSDLDLVAVTRGPLGAGQQRQLRQIHRRLVASEPLAARLHCVYVPVGDLPDIAARHVTWAARTLFRRPFSGVARAELTRHGFAVFGPPPAGVIPAVTAGELREAVLRELGGYWRTALRRPSIWLTDSCVDLALLTLGRAEAALADGQLITKAEALTRLEHFSAPPHLITEIQRRRDGQAASTSLIYRIRRARLARHLVSRGIDSLLSPGARPQ